jgi:hypothetical protein
MAPRPLGRDDGRQTLEFVSALVKRSADRYSLWLDSPRDEEPVKLPNAKSDTATEPGATASNKR